MSGFKVHATGGLVAGLLVGLGVLTSGMISVWQSIYFIFLGILGGILPDLDSNTGRPVKLLFFFTTSLIVLFVVITLRANGNSFRTIIVSCAVAYIICFVFFSFFKKFTKHRGAMHSIPFAVFVGALIALANLSQGMTISLFSGLSAFIGVMSHLLLDELNSIGFKYGVVPRLKKSFGSALKLTGGSIKGTIVIYSITAITLSSYIIAVFLFK
ncbi:MAG: metal-dependent hydrolase [Thermodesulfobacteriota bacterium]|nr:metal-dependent hydrolase [Thermodesulfobacteriota bacterium]